MCERVARQRYHPADEPASSRAWIMQEFFLSPRILVYGTNQLYWKCRFKVKTNGGYIEEFALTGGAYNLIILSITQ